MLRLFKLFLVLAIVTTTALPVNGNDFTWQRYWTGCGWAYRKVAVAVQPQAINNTTTVVNNLIGIPVPVQYSQPIAAQGTTVYGYQGSMSDYYNQVDMGLLYNQAARLTDQAQQLAGQASTDFQTLVHAEGQYRAQVAQTLARGQAARDALLATGGQQPQQVVTQRSFSFKVTQGADGQFKVEQDKPNPVGSGPDFNLINQDQVMNAVSGLLTNKCVACHNAEKAAGGLNFLGPITDAQQRSVLARVTTEDQTKLMPRKADGSPGERLSTDELSLLFRAMNGAQK